MKPEEKAKRIQEGYNIIREGLRSDQPFFAGRMGMTESQLCQLMKHKQHEIFSNNVNKDWINQVTCASGVYPHTKESFINFVDQFKESIHNMNVIGEWIGIEDEYINSECKKVLLRSLDVVDPNPWTRELDGKNVVIIHPFSTSIHNQVLNRYGTWDTNEWCPEFGFATNIQTKYCEKIQDDGYSSWEEELDRIINRLPEKYDVALIGCGAIGALVGNHVYKSGKKAIHMGGCLQLMFGIRGKRWEDNPEYAALMNEHWVRPLDFEKPNSFPTFSACDKDCYF